MAAQGRTEEARKEYGLIKAKFPELWKMFGVLHNVYSMGFHDGAHRAAMQYYEENQKVEKDQDLE